jgi:hypothetical protein
MNAAELRERVATRLLNEIQETKFPSTTMLNRVEQTLDDPQALAAYTETLIEKVEATRFPSVDLLNRIDGLIARLDEQERRQQEERRQQ